jgi:hypothetical protein
MFSWAGIFQTRGQKSRAESILFHRTVVGVVAAAAGNAAPTAKAPLWPVLELSGGGAMAFVVVSGTAAILS